MLYCKNCDRYFDEIDDNLWVGRDGDPYDLRTNFWYICPYCNNRLEDIDD